MASREPGRPTAATPPPADELRANAYADGYGEGLRDALRELLQAARSSTPQELRWQIESRLARIPQDVELKRRALLGPPSRREWDAARPRNVPAAPTPPATLTGTLSGSGLLFKEPTPVRAAGHVAGAWRAYGRVIAFGRAPDPPLAVPPASLEVLPVGRAGPFASDSAPDLAGAAGQLRERLATGPALVYCDAVEYLAGEYGEETAVRSIGWIVEQVRAGAGWVVISVDPSTLSAVGTAQLQRFFRGDR